MYHYNGKRYWTFARRFLLGEHGSTFAKQAAVSAAGCLTVSCLFELVLFSKKRCEGCKNTRYTCIVLYIAFSLSSTFNFSNMLFRSKMHDNPKWIKYWMGWTLTKMISHFILFIDKNSWMNDSCQWTNFSISFLSKNHA